MWATALDQIILPFKTILTRADGVTHVNVEIYSEYGSKNT